MAKKTTPKPRPFNAVAMIDGRRKNVTIEAATLAEANQKFGEMYPGNPLPHFK